MNSGTSMIRIASAQPELRARGAFSLVELLVSIGVAGIVLAATVSLWMFSMRCFAAIGNYGDLDAASRNALDTMTRDIRMVRELTNYSSTRLMFKDYDTNSLVYVYDPVALTLTRQKGGTNTVLLTQCDYLNFDISKRNPSNDFTFYPTTNLSEAKLIDMSWRCSRQIMAAKVNTESVQTAKIVIRN